ncbi:hypothetical protein [Roseateles chitinivorans]|uniref:hypothetical protein n=1 Tax=Roseateles chitinivorans TaxID=2917965 RepID=UPI003D67AD1E
MIALTPSTAIRFDFAHSIALRSLTIHAKPDPLAQRQLADKSTGRWQLQAVDDQGRTHVLARRIEIDRLGGQPIRVDTGGVPYRSYRLQGEDGYFPTESWWTEVTFMTEKAGRPATTRHRRDSPSVDVDDAPGRQAGLLAQAAAHERHDIAFDPSTVQTPSASKPVGLLAPSVL